jgi:hypothetical protein
MSLKKTLQQREKELQALLATPGGQAELQELEARYTARDSKLRSKRTSLITYILVYEREHGLIAS